MKIYTYYEDINHTNQEKMLELWQLSWANAGFNPIILTKKDAQQHNFYESFVEQIKNLHKEIMQKEISSYGLSCYVRWLAYASQSQEKFYVSDYDCVNNGLKPEKLSDKIHLMDADCPCFASGSPEQFEQLCHNFVEISLSRMEKLKELKNNNPCYHDQDFFSYNFINRYNDEASKFLEKYNILMTRDRDGVGPCIDIQDKKNNTYKVLHISHHNADMIKEDKNNNLTNKDINTIRVEIMNKIIKWNQ